MSVVVSGSGYSTAGNGGRKLVRLKNGTLVAAFVDGKSFYLKKSIDMGNTWSEAGGVYSTFTDIALAVINDVAYILTSNNNTFVSLYKYENGTRSLIGHLASSETSLGNVSYSRLLK